MAEYDIILVDPITPGNIGAIARLMKNFGFDRLAIRNPPEVDDEAIARAMHAQEILEGFEQIDSLYEKLSGYDLVVGTSGIITSKEKKFLRKANTPEEFAEDTKDYDGRIAILFGREDQGLSNDELEYCDKMLNIPSSDEYPILNLSHAVGIVLYELFKAGGGGKIENRDTITDESERERVSEFFSEILDLINYPEHKKPKTKIMFRKLLGRATTTKWEYHRLMGVLSKIKDDLEK